MGDNENNVDELAEGSASGINKSYSADILSQLHDVMPLLCDREVTTKEIEEELIKLLLETRQKQTAQLRMVEKLTKEIKFLEEKAKSAQQLLVRMTKDSKESSEDSPQVLSSTESEDNSNGDSCSQNLETSNS